MYRFAGIDIRKTLLYQCELSPSMKPGAANSKAKKKKA